MRKDEYPEAIADLLGIPAQMGVAGPWMSNQGTVMKSWLLEVGAVIGVPYAGDKVAMMRELVESVGGTWNPTTMASTRTASGGGGNISKPAFEELLTGLRRRELSDPLFEIYREPDPFSRVGTPDREDDHNALRAIRVRRGQPHFRAALLRAYDGRCAVTNCDVEDVLEAAHITPYADGGTYDVTNGLLLRADIHTLLDSKRVSFDEDRRLAVHPAIRATTYRNELHGLPLANPADQRERVRDEDLRAHRACCQF